MLTSPLRSLQATSINTLASRATTAPRVRAVRAMAGAQYTAYVKGDPKTSTLGDCPFCHRVLLTLETKGAAYDKTFVDFDDKPQWLVEKHGGKVPVIQEGDFQLADSDKIVEWLEEKIPSPPMKGDAPEAAGKVFPAFRNYLLAKKEEEADKKADFESALGALDAALQQAPGPLLGGSQLNAADAALAPKLYHATTALKHYKSFDLGAQQGYGAVKAYIAAVKKLPAWEKTDYGEDAIIKGWAKHGAGKQ